MLRYLIESALVNAGVDIGEFIKRIENTNKKINKSEDLPMKKFIVLFDCQGGVYKVDSDDYCEEQCEVCGCCDEYIGEFDDMEDVAYALKSLRVDDAVIEEFTGYTVYARKVGES